MFSYADTHLHRIGTNHHLVPVNNPETNKNVKVCMYQRDGAMQTGSNQGSAPNYYRNTFNGPDVTDRSRHLEHATFESGMAARHDAADDDNFSQPRVFYQVRTVALLITHCLLLSRSRSRACSKCWTSAVERT